MSLLAGVARAGPSSPSIQKNGFQRWTVFLRVIQTRKYATPRNSGDGKPTRAYFANNTKVSNGLIRILQDKDSVARKGMREGQLYLRGGTKILGFVRLYRLVSVFQFRDIQVFRPMPVNQLSHPIFESERRDDLDLPVFQPVSYL